MDPTALATLLRDYGPWGLLALSLLTNRWLFLKYDGAMKALIAYGEKVAVGLQSSTRATEEIAKLTAQQEAKLSLLAERVERWRSP